jgi:general secretion pathway protein G
VKQLFRGEAYRPYRLRYNNKKLKTINQKEKNMKSNSNKFRRTRKNRKYTAGFTLIEIMVVLFIILAMAGAAVLAYGSYLESGRKKTTKQYIDNLNTAVETFNVDIGRYPSGLHDLLECPSGVSPSKWNGPYVKNLQQSDPWQNEYRYEAPGRRNPRSFDLWSVGQDGQDGNEDDIGNWAD